MNSMRRVGLILVMVGATLLMKVQAESRSIATALEACMAQMRCVEPDSAVIVAEQWCDRHSMDDVQRSVACADTMLYRPYSDYYARVLYRTLLSRLLQGSCDSDVTMLRYRYRHEMLCSNNEGDTATDFTFYDPVDAEHKLRDYIGESTLIIFNDPGCEECARLRAHILSGGMMGGVAVDESMTVLVIYPDNRSDEWEDSLSHYPSHWIVGYSEDVIDYYDLRVLPSVYMLDENHRIVQRDSHVDVVSTSHR